MSFNCDSCGGEYDVASANASARVYLENVECNHIEVRCSHCGAVEVIYLRPHRLEKAIRESNLPTTIRASASQELRDRAARAWAEAEASARPGPNIGAELAVRTYDLTNRHEVLLRSFAVTLENMPTELLFEELRAEHERRHPERWVD